MHTIQYGTAFYFNNRPGNNHLHFVISNPAQPELMIVNVTTPRGRSDRSCVLEVVDFGELNNPSRIAYEFAELIATEDLTNYIADGTVRVVGQLSDDALKKVWDGAIATAHLTLRLLHF